MGPKKPIRFGYSLSHFLNFPEQLASRIEDHQTLGNHVCHLIGAPIIGVAALALVHVTAGYYPALICSLLLTLWCLSVDFTYGLIYGIYNISTSMYQLNRPAEETLSLYTALAMIVLSAFIQLGIGHAFFEQRPPNEVEGVVKGDGKLFALLDFANEAIFGTFHFYSIAMLKFGFRPSVDALVQAELRRLKSLMAGGL